MSMTRLTSLAFGLSLFLVACAQRSKGPPSIIGVSPEHELTEEAKVSPPPPATDPEVVQKAAREFTGYRAADDRSFARESFLTHLAAADAVCIGERHDAPLDHFAELSLIHALAERRAMRGFQLAVGFEMVRKKYQAALNAFGQGVLSVDQFRTASAWDKEWGFPLEYYAPSIEAARAAQAASLAFGVDRELTAAVAQSGLDALPAKLSRDLPDLDLDNAEHRKLFDGMMVGHPAGNPEFYYEAQVIWDESMADQSFAFLRAHAPGRKLIVLAGVAHCHRLAIPSRIERRGSFQVVSVLPVEAQPVKPKSTGEASLDERLAAGYDYQLVFSAP